MLRKRYYILFVARDEDGRVRKIPVPIRYAYGFVAAAVVGAFTIVGLAGSYTRMLIKTESYNQVRLERESLRKDYKQMAQIAHDRDVQVASLGALASEVSALYGLRQSRLATTHHSAAASAAVAPVTEPLAISNDVNPQAVSHSIDQLTELRDYALSGRVSLALADGLSPNSGGDWTVLADAPTLWPIEGRVTSSFGEREDPINGEGEFHRGIDIGAPLGSPVRATADGIVTGADLGRGYGRTVELNNGHDIMTVYAHLDGLAVVAGQHVSRGQVIGYVGDSGRATGPNLHYEVRIDGVPVNPYKYLRDTFTQFARLDANAGQHAAGQ